MTRQPVPATSIPDRTHCDRKSHHPNSDRAPTHGRKSPDRKSHPLKIQSAKNQVQSMLAGGSMLMALGLLVDIHALAPMSSPGVALPKDVCQQVAHPDAILSRANLAQLLAIPERSSQATARQVLPPPYCTLQPVAMRAGVTAQREAYPLDFDAQAWLVVLYEGGEYAGYSFSFRH